MDIRFLSAVFPGFLGSEDAPTTATLWGLKNAFKAATSRMSPSRLATAYHVIIFTGCIEKFCAAALDSCNMDAPQPSREEKLCRKIL
jgi:hypothetical protein